MVVDPVRAGNVSSYDSTDQGVVNTLLYKGRIYGAEHERFARLHPMYNVIARHAKHTELKWRAPGANLTAALLHFTRETRPWQIAPQLSNVTRAAEWARGCGPAVCGGLVGKRHLLNDKLQAAARGYVPPPNVGIHAAWEPFCGLVPSNDTSRNSTSSRGHGMHSNHSSLHFGRTNHSRHTDHKPAQHTDR